MGSILILYTELAVYNVACFNLLVERGYQLHVVKYPVNAEAPFDDFNFSKSITFYNRKELSETDFISLLNSLNPSLVLCSGWADKMYLKGLEYLRNKNIPKILSLDNQWRGTFKQLIGCVYSRLYLKKLFTHCFVPGDLQEVFASKLGFNKNKILKGFYTADIDFFNQVFAKNIIVKRKEFPHVFIYVGRYYDFKGVNELWKAFEIFKSVTNNNWELWCLGTGTVDPYQHPSIKHFGFIQPRNLPDYMTKAGVFILPSKFEPWAVVVHEFAAAGFPLIVSDKVGSSVAFVVENVNGKVFTAGNVNSMVEQFKLFASKSDQELFEMGSQSHNIAQNISPQLWVESLIKLIA